MTIKKFQDLVWNFYRQHSRFFKWRLTLDPYQILVSEIMLQQTQTERVKIKYDEWIIHFPTITSLAKAPLQKVLTHWQGLGYNRRALALKKLAEIVVEKYDSEIPNNYEKILELPGIGPYTAGAVMAFAFNKPYPIIETNIRTVFIHSFFEDKFGQIHDQEILELVKKTLPPKTSAKSKQNIRNWYYALMDYGVHLKKTIGNLNTRSKHYTKQSKFKGSNREIRSNIVKAITAATKPLSKQNLQNYFKKNKLVCTEAQLEKNLYDLEREGFITKEKKAFRITS